MKTPGVTFVGTSHIDPDGYSRLAEALQRIRPEIILVEVSPLSIILRTTLGRIFGILFVQNLRRAGITENPEMLSIKTFCHVPYEYQAVRDYCRRTGARFVFADSSLFTLIRYPRAWRLFTRKNLEKAAKTMEDPFKSEKTAACRVFSGTDRVLRDIRLAGFRKDRLLAVREKLLYRRVTRVLSRHAGKHCVYVGGWEHCMDDPGGLVLYSRMESPRERLIIFL